MPFETDPTISREQSPKGHGLHLTGPAYATLCGHGYREHGVSHLEPIQRLWERHMGLGTKSRSFNKAMDVGKKMERIAFEDCAEKLRNGQLNDHKDYNDARLFEVYRGLYLSQAKGDEHLPDAVNVDGPLIDTRGTYTDPKSGREINGVLYASRRAQEAAMIARREEDNEMLRADGEEAIPIPDRKYSIPERYSGAIDMKVTQLKRSADEVRLMGMSGAWPIQTAHYNRVLREQNELNGYDISEYPNLMGVYHYCTETMEGYYYHLPHDPELEKEMQRRGDLFRHCVENNIPPNSSEMAHEFYIYKVKGIEPEAVVPPPHIEQLFADLLKKRDSIDGAIEQLNEYKANINKSLERGLKKLNYRDKGTVPQGVIVDTKAEGGKSIRYIHMKDSARRSTVVNEATLNSTLMAAAGSKELQEKMLSTLRQEYSDSEKVTELSQLIQQLGKQTQSVPDPEAGVLDIGHYTSKQLKDTEKGRQLSVSTNKEIRMIYERAKERGSDIEVGTHDHEKDITEAKVSRNDQKVELPEGVGVSAEPDHSDALMQQDKSPESIGHDPVKEEGGSVADRMELPTAEGFPMY